MRRNISGLRRFPSGKREGRKQRLIRRRLLVANGQPVSAREFMELIHGPGPHPEWRWAALGKSATKWAERVFTPRSRPLMWKPKPGSLGAIADCDRLRPWHWRAIGESARRWAEPVLASSMTIALRPRPGALDRPRSAVRLFRNRLFRIDCLIYPTPLSAPVQAKAEAARRPVE